MEVEVTDGKREDENNTDNKSIMGRNVVIVTKIASHVNIILSVKWQI